MMTHLIHAGPLSNALVFLATFYMLAKPRQRAVLDPGQVGNESLSVVTTRTGGPGSGLINHVTAPTRPPHHPPGQPGGHGPAHPGRVTGELAGPVNGNSGHSRLRQRRLE